MNNDDLIATRTWVRRWAELADLPERTRSDRGAPLSKIIPLFNGSFRSAMALHPPQPWSGLIEQQAIFRKAKR